MIKSRLTYANVAATLALVFSMTGGAMAARHYLITSTKQISPKVIKALKGGTGKTGAIGPQGPPGKEGKESTNALNALALGGIPASGYTRNDCNSTTGQIKGFALVPASASFPSSFTKISLAYNCSGQEVLAKRIEAGEYEIKFVGNPAAIVVGNSNQSGAFPDLDLVSFAPVGGGDWKVAVWNTITKGFIDDPFEVIVP